MKKWEYSWFTMSRGIKGSWTGVYVTPENWDKDLNAEMQKHGENGWELVSAIPRSDFAGTQGAGFTSSITFIFKRLKEE